MNVYLGNLITEKVNEKSKNIDMCGTKEILEIINSEDRLVPDAVAKEIPNIAKAVDVVVDRLKSGGKLFYVGAGTSGRLGILDASECPPTYGVSHELVQGIIAGGYEAIFKAVEGAEDDEEAGKRVIYEKKITDRDVVVGITASGRTPYVLGAVRAAKIIGAITIGVSNNSTSLVKDEADIAITPVVGPEVVMGSTRMKAGTAQKLVLNMITTASMIKLGKVYGNLMVDLQPTNKKLVDRTIRIVSYATGLSEEEVKKYLNESRYRPKVAIVMIKTGVDAKEAEKLLNKADGFVSRAIGLYNLRNE